MWRSRVFFFFFFNDTATTEIYTLSLHDALPILPWEVLYADDLILMAASQEELMEKIKQWKNGLEEKGLRVNMSKTKIMKCRYGVGQVEATSKHPCGVCRKGVRKKSIYCFSCKKWIHKRCSGVKE